MWVWRNAATRRAITRHTNCIIYQDGRLAAQNNLIVDVHVSSGVRAYGQRLDVYRGREREHKMTKY